MLGCKVSFWCFLSRLPPKQENRPSLCSRVERTLREGRLRPKLSEAAVSKLNDVPYNANTIMSITGGERQDCIVNGLSTTKALSWENRLVDEIGARFSDQFTARSFITLLKG